VLADAARQIFRRLMDAVDPALTAAAEEAVRGTDGVEDLEELRLRWIGHRLRAEVAITVDAGATIVAAHDVAEDARHRLLHAVPRLHDAIVHTSPGRRADSDPHRMVAHHFDPAAPSDHAGHDHAGHHDHAHAAEHDHIKEHAHADGHDHRPPVTRP
jgi:hypothetical protein